jgi:hypothetical protein
MIVWRTAGKPSFLLSGQFRQTLSNVGQSPDMYAQLDTEQKARRRGWTGRRYWAE